MLKSRYTKLIINFAKNFTINITSQCNVKPVDLAYFKYENPKTINILPPLFIMHGLFGSKKSWRSTCRAMILKIHQRKIYALDARNHGNSPHTADHRYEDMAADIIQIMKKENIKKIALLGHSMGGKCMMYMALKYPQFVDCAVIIDITPVSPSDSLNHLGIILHAIKHVKLSSKFKLANVRNQADEQLQELNIKSKQTRDFILTNLIQYPNGQYGWRINVEVLDKCFATYIAKFPTDVSDSKYYGPVLFIGGTTSDFVSQEKLEDIRKTYFPSAELITFPKTGHLVHIEQQALLIDTVVAFLY